MKNSAAVSRDEFKSAIKYCISMFQSVAAASGAEHALWRIRGVDIPLAALSSLFIQADNKAVLCSSSSAERVGNLASLDSLLWR